jgi:pSer/pThr/pTyr-binding forkhead associated (FHA) protein
MGGNDTIIQEEEPRFKNIVELRKRGLLVVLSGDNLGCSGIVYERPLMVGRDADCQLKIADDLMSKKHFSISPISGERKFILKDLDSTNSTFLNKKKVKKPVQIYYGDRIVAGNTVFRFFLEEQKSEKGKKG